MEPSENIKKSVSHFFSGTLLSRLTGLCREITMAAFFGSSPSVAAFWMAYRFSNVLRRLLGEGALQASFIPMYEEKRHKVEGSGAVFCQRVHSSLVFVLFGVVLMLELGLF